jgi:hypothetical protein
MTFFDPADVAVRSQRLPTIHSFKGGCEPGQESVSGNTGPNQGTENTLRAIRDASDR